MKQKIIFLIFYFTCVSFLNARSDVSNHLLTNKNSEKKETIVEKEVGSFFFLTCPVDSTITVTTSCDTTATWTEPTSSDPDVIVEGSHTPDDPDDPNDNPSLFPIGETIVTYIATDTVTNEIVGSCSFIITVTFDKDPASNFIFPDEKCDYGDITKKVVESCDRRVTWIEPSVPCPEIQLLRSHDPGQEFPIGTTIVKYTAFYNLKILDECTFTVTVRDTIPPVFDTCSTNIVLDADNNCGAVANWTEPKVSDNCDHPIDLVSDFDNGTAFPLGTTTVTYTATDQGGNSVECSFDVTVVDNTGPEFLNIPTEVRVSANENCEAVATWDEILVEDNCSTTIITTSNFNSGDVFTLGETIIEYSATDSLGNESIASFKVIVEDNTAPTVISCPQDITVSAKGNCNALVNWTSPEFFDNCDTNLTISSSHDVRTQFPLGTTVVTYTAIDAAGNESTCSFNVNVVDEKVPQFATCVADMIVYVNNDCKAVAEWTTPEVTDNCDFDLVSDYASGDLFPLGLTTVTYTATDDSGNTAQCSFDVTVLDNIGPELLNVPAVIEVSADENCEAIATWEPIIAEDNCSQTVDVARTFKSGDIFPLGETTVEVLAIDESNNETTSSFTIIVEDNAAPQVISCPADITISANGNCESMVTWEVPEFSENCDKDLSITSTHNNGTQFPLGLTTVTYTATDNAGNSNDCSFNVIVEDNSAPKVTYCPDKQTISANDNCLGIAEWEEPVFEDCSNLSVRSNYQIGMELSSGITLIEYVATDDNGNATSCSFEVEVLDQTPPKVENCPKDISISASDNCKALVEWDEPTVTDNCTEARVSSNYKSGSSFPIGKTTVEYEFTDAAGNISLCSFEINVLDDSEILINNCPQDITLKAENNSGNATVSWDAPIATSECSVITVDSSHDPGSTFEVGTTLVTYTFTKQNGETENCSFDITVKPLVLKIDINKLITPNGDGNNDYWHIDGIEQFPDNHLIIVDRWGAEIYSATGYNNNKVVWNGENKSGEIVPRGTYYYYITVRNEEDAIERKGFIEILR